MRTRLLAVATLFAASLYGQRPTRQDYCFNNPTSPVCPGHDMAIKPTPAPAPSPVSVTRFSSPGAARGGNAQMISVGGIDWRFADPNADIVMGFNFTALANSPLTRLMIAQLGAQNGLSDANVQKILDPLADAEQVAFPCAITKSS